MRLAAAVLFLTLAMSLGSPLFAKAYFQTEAELVTQSAYVAIIDLMNVRKTEEKGAHWTYRQRARVTVVQRIKGSDLPDEFALHGHETFICAQCHLAPGRYLAFLNRDGTLYVGANWQFSLRPVKEDKIEWFDSAEQRSLSLQPTKDVLGRIEKLLAQSGAAAKASGK